MLDKGNSVKPPAGGAAGTAGACTAGPGAAGAAAAGAAPPCSARSTSTLMMRPWGPLPVSAARSRPAWAAIRLASGLAMIRSLSTPFAALAGFSAGAGAGAAVAGASTVAGGAAGGGGAAAPALKPSRAEESSPSSSSRPITALTGTFSAPSATTILPKVPSSTASTSMVALSVSISAITSPAEIFSPSFLSQRARLPSVMVGDRAGIRSSIGISVSQRFLLAQR